MSRSNFVQIDYDIDEAKPSELFSGAIESFSNMIPNKTLTVKGESEFILKLKEPSQLAYIYFEGTF